MLLMLEKAAHLIVSAATISASRRRATIWFGTRGAGFRAGDFAECEFAWCSWDGNAKVLTRDPLANRDYEHKGTQRKSRCGFWNGP